MTTWKHPFQSRPGGIKRMCGGRAAIIPADVVRGGTISHGEFHLYSALCSYADERGICWPSMARLASDLRVKERTIYNYLVELETIGLIYKISKPGDRGVYFVARHPDDRMKARALNVRPVAKRKAHFGELGRKGARIKQAKRRAAVSERAKENSEPDGNILHGNLVNGVSPRTVLKHESSNMSDSKSVGRDTNMVERLHDCAVRLENCDIAPSLYKACALLNDNVGRIMTETDMDEEESRQRLLDAFDEIKDDDLNFSVVQSLVDEVIRNVGTTE